ncbi:hypothetical protein [Zhongshania sp.]|uniref:hypothetical protein n=1 Tax=Zhongshania sp. TaxID=1971902 RepID=UPI001B6AF483|nr:hypothetical protein [Zhongshania sp.]MBQ0758909.1 hypothetical protein [Zhongshania sp.]MBQ0794858.1 hypothetical protein [Zhongshania sp.]
MRSASIRIFLAIVILLQSFAAVADAHQFHQANDQHEAISEHLHALDTVDAVEQQSDLLDCHHCCHCHGMTTSVVPPSHAHMGLFGKPAPKFDALTQYPTQVSSSLYRPPIA